MRIDVQFRKGLRTQARRLRSLGWSYGQIGSKLNVAKSTLNSWFRDLPPSEHQSLKASQVRIRKIQHLGAAANARLRVERLERMREEARKIVSDFFYKDKSTQEALLAMLYWAEGEKNERTGLVLANTDPALLVLYISLLRSCYPIEESKLKARVHLHHYHDASTALKFWSEALNIPINQFGKIYRKKRSTTRRFRQNFQGICFVAYNNTALKNRLMFVAKGVQEKICSNTK